MAIKLDKIALCFLSPKAVFEALGSKPTFDNQLQSKSGKDIQR